MDLFSAFAYNGGMLTQVQTYQQLLDNTNANIRLLMEKRALLTQHLRTSQVAEIAQNDAAFLQDLQSSPRDWPTLLNTKTPSRAWSEQVKIQGVSASSEWVQVEERAVTLRFYEEMPERMDVYAQLLEQMLPFMQPWKSDTPRTNGGKFVSVSTENQRCLLGVDDEHRWTLIAGHGRDVKHFSNMQEALLYIQARWARPFFENND